MLRTVFGDIEEELRGALSSTFGGWVLSLHGAFGQESMPLTAFGGSEEVLRGALSSTFGGWLLSLRSALGQESML